jgi:hypothetical protein
MARPRYPVSTGPPPPPLPPETRTVGQLIAETIKLYGERFYALLPLGLVVATADQASLGLDLPGRVAVLLVAAPAFSFAFAWAAGIVAGARPASGVLACATLTGTVVFLPAAFLLPWFAVAAVAVLALFGNAVPAAVIERRGVVGSLRRSITVARADIVHALGGLATLMLLFGLTRLAMGFLLRAQADNAIRVAIFLADTVLGPVLFVGGALLFVDLAARVGTTRAGRQAARLAPRDAAPPAE